MFFMQAKSKNKATNAIVRQQWKLFGFEYMCLMYVHYFKNYAKVEDINVKYCLN